jgi:hypothetical protein
MAADAGFLLDGARAYTLLLELSKILEEAIAVDDPCTHKPAYAPGGERRVPYQQASDTTKDTRWNQVVRFFGRAKRSVGLKDFSTMVGEGVANGIVGKGHGADPRRKLGARGPLLDALLARPEVRERIKKKIAEMEKPDDYANKCILRKRKSCATYDMIDAYRDLFLIKHPSRSTMSVETKKLIAYLYSNVMACGEEWSTEEELEEVRLRTARGAAEEVVQAEEKERTDVIYREWCRLHLSDFAAAARARWTTGSKWMRIAKEAWATAAENPKNQQQVEVGDALRYDYVSSLHSYYASHSYSLVSYN